MARQALQEAYERAPSLDLLRARALLDGHDLSADPALLQHLQRQPTLGAAAALLQRPCRNGTSRGPGRAHGRRPRRPTLQRYRCAACGFEAQRYFWQCPGCLSWDSFPPERIEEL
jgi:lipopolysaccharide biosynthesis regulator YciM